MGTDSSHGKRFATGILAAIGVATLVSACTSSTNNGTPSSGSTTQNAFDASAPAVTGGSATIGLPAGGIDHLEPTLWYYATSWEVAYATCTPLLTFPDQTGNPGDQVVGGVADLPVMSDGGKTYTFTLRSGITFSNGNPITAADIEYTWLRMLSPALASPADGFFTDIVGAADYSAGKTKTIPGITISGNTITFKLDKPIGSFLYRMTLPFACPVPQGTPMKAIEDGSILGSGPYVVQSYTVNRELVLTRNTHYNAIALGARGKLDTITIQIGVDANAAGLQIRAGSMVTYLDRLASADAATALADPTLKGRVFVGTLPATTYLWMNSSVAPFNNAKVRQAVNYAINRDALLRVWGGPSQGSVTDQVLPPTMPGWQKAALYPSAGDTAKAKALLAASGVALPISTTLRVRNDAPGYLSLAQAVQAQLAAVGINADIKSAPDSSNGGVISATANKVPMGINTWTQDYPDPDDFFGTLLDGNRITPTNNNNYASYNNPASNAKIEGMDAVTGTGRASQWNAIDQQIIGQDAPWAPLINPNQVGIVAKGFCGYVFHPVYLVDLTTLGKCS
jgi:peptide/nickel transport system substrate-binding protein